MSYIKISKADGTIEWIDRKELENKESQKEKDNLLSKIDSWYRENLANTVDKITNPLILAGLEGGVAYKGGKLLVDNFENMDTPGKILTVAGGMALTGLAANYKDKVWSGIKKQFKAVNKRARERKKADISPGFAHYFKNLTGVVAVTSLFLFNPQIQTTQQDISTASNSNIGIEQIVQEKTLQKHTNPIRKYNNISESELRNIRNLSMNKSKIDFTEGKVEGSLQYQRENFRKMSIDDMMEHMGLGGLYRTYTDWDGEVDYKSALRNMMDKKIEKAGWTGKFKDFVDDLANTYDPETSNRISFDNYKLKTEFQIGMLKKVFNKNSYIENKHAEKKDFFQKIHEHLDSDVMISYLITELLPSQRSPVFNIEFLDRILTEGGEELINRIPALKDVYMSYGGYQLTSKVIHGKSGATSLNQYLPEHHQMPESMVLLEGTKDHVTGAYLTAIYNTAIVGNIMFNNGLLSEFNDYFETLDENKQKALVTGIIATSHNNPGRMANGLVNYVDQTRMGKEDFDNILSRIQVSWSQGYWDQSIETYLTMENLYQETRKDIASEIRSGLRK